ncbi:putative C-type lectin domain family 20 member A [Poeciliopsis prolifica]|uniref:putative C-type lectin domain family 20 member A n=1 Tax=Poeciliopsis prolifica TaxID=188132 RepID=UPI002413F214|nr:putative C-type lectin domain family 20 member A [Poeciliopsis prolifica]
MERILLVLFLSACLVLSGSLPRQYHFVDKSLTWTEAQAYCRQTYTDIATIQDSEELTRLMDTLSSAWHRSDTWIGLYSVIHWMWSDGFEGAGANYSNWEIIFNEPNFDGASQFCVTIDGAGLWSDDYCAMNYSVLCYNGTQLDPAYVYVKKEMNWTDAQMYCRENFIDLATVSSDLQNRMVEELVPTGVYSWIGLFRSPNLFWSDGINNWDNGYNPIDSMTIICGITSARNKGKWGFLSCETKLPVVCYHIPNRTKQSMKLRLTTEDSVNLNEAVVKESILKKLQDRLKENGVNNINLKWREQPDGEVFKKEVKPFP